MPQFHAELQPLDGGSHVPSLHIKFHVGFILQARAASNEELIELDASTVDLMQTLVASCAGHVARGDFADSS
jgi:hypothetical protein